MVTDGGDPVLVNLLSPSSVAAHVTFGDTSSSQYQSQSQPPYVVTDYPDGIYMRSVSDSSISDGEPGEDEEDVSDGTKNEERDQNAEGAQDDASEDGEEKHDNESHQNATGNDSTKLLPLKRKPEVNFSVVPSTHDGAEKGNVVVEDSATATTSPEPRIDLLHLITNVFTGVPDRKKSEDVDILEIASMAGIRFDPPRWWRPGGYDMLKKDK